MAFSGDTVFAKTELGRQEIGTRRAKLDPRTRMLLVMIDGAHTVDALAAKLGGTEAVQAALEKLAGLGLIAAAGASTAAPVPAAAVAAAGGDALAKARREAIAALHDAMGPDADLFAERLERASTPAQFLDELARVGDVLAGVAGRARADAFLARVRQHLG
jgi:type IV secretory pathway VirJ component